MSSDNISSLCGSDSCVDLVYLYHFEAIVRVVVPPIFGLIAFVGLVGNLLVVLVVVAGRHGLMHSTTNVLIINLAVADLLFIVFCVPFTATGYALPVWTFGNAWCKVGGVLGFTVFNIDCM